MALSFALAASASLSAGDIASFVNLGFSGDSSYFMFGQYGVSDGNGASYAEVYTVDNARNAFVPGTTLKASNSLSLDVGQDGSGTFFNLLEESARKASSCQIDHQRQGRLLYVLMNGEEPKSELCFRDFKAGTEYKLMLDQKVLRVDGSVSSSFGLSVSQKKADGSVKMIEAGSPNVRRPGVSGYVIRRALLSPDERYLVVVIEKKEAAKDAVSVRYMVETLRLK
jgi:predicted secreted protein